MGCFSYLQFYEALSAFCDALAGFMPLVIGGIFYLSGKWKEKAPSLGSPSGGAVRKAD